MPQLPRTKGDQSAVKVMRDEYQARRDLIWNGLAKMGFDFPETGRCVLRLCPDEAGTDAEDHCKRRDRGARLGIRCQCAGIHPVQLCHFTAEYYDST